MDGKKKLTKEMVISAIEDLYYTHSDPDVETDIEIFNFSPKTRQPHILTKKEITQSEPVDIKAGQYNYWSDEH